jgi:tripeptide aminopeptidase
MSFGRLLVKEMQAIGLQQVQQDENGYVTGMLPVNTDKKFRPIGLIAHMDTSPDFSAENVKAQFHENYDGGEILLSSQSGLSLSPNEFPELKQYIGQTLITTDGMTLLGADDKAGIAEILTALDELIHQPDAAHGDVWVGFTPDEEIGRGADLFNVRQFPVDFALTVDGGPLGEFVYENFNAAAARVEIAGRSVHPGEAKQKMINSLEVALQFHLLMPQAAKPEFTDSYDGFIHLVKMEGGVEKTTLSYIIRDHDAEKLQRFKDMFLEAREFVNVRYKRKLVSVFIKDQYQNMKAKIEPHGYIMDLVKTAMKKAGVTMYTNPIRGGTDGARLSFMGLPTPNLFTGGHNAHGPYEFISVESMLSCVAVIKAIILETALE